METIPVHKMVYSKVIVSDDEISSTSHLYTTTLYNIVIILLMIDTINLNSLRVVQITIIKDDNTTTIRIVKMTIILMYQ